MAWPIHSGATPVGLGARDTLRLEKGYLLSGVDFRWPELPESTNFWHEIHGKQMSHLD